MSLDITDLLQGGPDLVGFVEVANDILAGTYEPISSVFQDNTSTYWDLYDTITPA